MATVYALQKDRERERESGRENLALLQLSRHHT